MSSRLSSGPIFSIVVCTRDRAPELERCLDGIRRQKYPRFDVLVIDSAPQNAVAFEIARRSGATYVMEPQLGLSRARNRGVRASTGEIIAFLDDDAVPEPSWLQNLVAEFRDPRVAAVAGRIRELRSPGEPPNEVADFYSLDCLGDQRRAVDRENPEWFEMANFGGVGQGSNMAFRRSALPSWALFDQRLGRGSRISGGEEHYAFFNLIEMGFRIVYAPNAAVYHPYPPDLRALREHHLRHLAAATGYITFLYFAEPNYRRRILRYVSEALLGVRRTWRTTSMRCPARLVSRCQSYAALLLGPLLYLRTQLENVQLFHEPAVPLNLSTPAEEAIFIPASLRRKHKLGISAATGAAQQD